MRFTGWICSLLFACSAFAAHANDCISQTEMSEIAASFPQFRSLAGAEYCLDDSPTAHLLGGIMFMRQTRFAPDMPKSNDDLFSGRFASSWWDYFIGRINEFQVEGSCAKGVVAYVYWFGNTMYVCPMALTANMTALDLASVFMHEARHIDGFPHTTCTHGPRQGLQGACDSRISQGGSYAVTVETYAQLAKYAPDIHPAMRAYSRSSAAIYANEAFETPVRVDLRTQYLIMTDDGEFHELNVVGETATKLAGHAPAVGQIFMRGQHMILYPQ
ncbi:MAG TPA: hypothetical protein PKC28_08285, partial [Bdellovibrionales bacterium]|nr:hypothetical protein [Bdellovibrionales bacterium]